MRLLLDSCALLALGAGTLSPAAKRALGSADEACVSIVSPWELAIRVHGGKLQLPLTSEAWFLALAKRHTLHALPLALETATAAAALPPLHRDPFDRVLIALAQARALTILTSDRVIPTYPGVQTLW